MSFKKMLLVGMLNVLVGAQCSGAAARQDEKNEMLLHAVKAGNAATVQNLLDQKANPDVNCNWLQRVDQTALHIAVEKGHVDIVLALLAAKACPDKVDAMGRTALHKAVFCDHDALITILLDNGASTDIVETFLGCTVLDTVARQLKFALVDAFIDAHFNAIIKQSPKTLIRAVHLKKNLILCIETALNLVIGDWEEKEQQMAIKEKRALINNRQMTIEVLTRGLNEAKGLDVDWLLEGDIICNGHPRFCMMQMDAGLESESDASEIDCIRTLRPGAVVDVEAGLAAVATNVDRELEASDVGRVRNTFRACPIS